MKTHFFFAVMAAAMLAAPAVSFAQKDALENCQRFFPNQKQC